MTGSTQDDYAAMMLAGGRSAEGNRSKTGRKTASMLVGSAKKPGKQKSSAAKSSAAKSSKSKSKTPSKSRSNRG
jgi:hypothetical protein